MKIGDEVIVLVNTMWVNSKTQGIIVAHSKKQHGYFVRLIDMTGDEQVFSFK